MPIATTPDRRRAPVEQQDFFLPRILAGEVHFAIGYTEPEAGTDLADYIWLACRGLPRAPR